MADLLPGLGVKEGTNTFPLPCYGVDVHKVIEQVHAILSRHMVEVLSRVGSNESVDFYRTKLEER